MVNCHPLAQKWYFKLFWGIVSLLRTVCLLHVWKDNDQFFEQLQCRGLIPSEYQIAPLPKPHRKKAKRFTVLIPSNQKLIQIAWSFNKLQKYFRHRTFWLNWLAYNLVFLIPWIHLLPLSKLPAIYIRREDGGEYYISQTCNYQRFEVRTFGFCLSVSKFLQLVVANNNNNNNNLYFVPRSLQ